MKVALFVTCPRKVIRALLTGPLSDRLFTLATLGFIVGAARALILEHFAR